MIRVAIVENDADERIKIRDCLTYLEQTDKTTFCITEFSSGTAFIGAYEPDYDIVFMDIEMPVMNGIEATKQIKNDSRYNKIPVIALTAHDIDEFQGQFTKLVSTALWKSLLPLIRFHMYSQNSTFNNE